MGQSLLIAMPVRWGLGSIVKALDSQSDLKYEEILVFDAKIAVHCHGGHKVVVEELSEHDPDVDAGIKEEYASTLTLDEQFRKQVNAMRLFYVRFNDLALMRGVLRCIARECVDKQESGWIDTGYRWVISAKEFLAKTDAKPDWDWRVPRPS